MERICLECIIFRKVKDSFEFLLLKRLPEKGDFWQPITGALEKTDKSELDGAYREILEETGISKNQIIRAIKNVHSFVITKHYLTQEDIIEVKEIVSGFEVNENVEINITNDLERDHSDFKWVSFKDAIKMMKWDTNKDAFKKLYSILTI